MRNTVTDPTLPGFPHGTENGSRFGCDCTPCKDAAYRANKLRRQRIARGIRRRSTPEDQARARQHVLELIAMHPGHNIENICRAAGLSFKLLGHFMRGKSEAIFTDSVEKVLAVTPDQIEKSCYPIEEARLLVGQMQALGYSMRWQAAQCGVDVPGAFGSPYPTVRSFVFNRIKELHQRIGDTPADCERDDMRPTALKQALGFARRNGYYPPIYYNEDGTLDHRSIPDHPWAKDDDKAHRKIAVLRAYVLNPEGLSNPEVAKVAGETLREVDRIVDRMGLQLDEPDRPKRMAWLKEQLYRFDADTIDPVRFALDVDLHKITLFSHDHPGVLSFKEDNPEWERRVMETARARKEARDAATARRKVQEVAA